MSRPVRELLDRLADRVGHHDRTVREDGRIVVDSLGITTNGTAVDEARLRDNVISLSAGDHGGMRLTKDGTTVLGSGDCNVTRQVKIDGSLVMLRGLRFVSRSAEGARNNADALVDVSASSKVVFVDCVFRKSDIDGGDFVAIAAGALVNFVGCTFLGGASATNAINNAGAAANVNHAFGANTSGSAHVNVTVTAELT